MRTLLLFTFALFAIPLFSQKYYTLASGNWNNTTNVWSLDGINPCGCFPGNSLITDTVIVKHPINLTAHLSASTLSKIQIQTGGSIGNTSFDLNITNSIVLANGSVSVRNLYIGNSGAFQLSYSTLIVAVNLDLYGSLTATFSNITVLGGNIQVFPSGSFVIGTNSRIHFISGNYKNEGYTSICSDCCLSFDKGNVTNESTGTFAGGGVVISDLGNIKNYGSWDPAITYCSSGNDVGMVSPENCLLAEVECTFAPLPAQLISLTGSYHDDLCHVTWETLSEMEVVSYEIERSSDGLNWEMRSVVPSLDNSNDLKHYTFSESGAGLILTYYKLTRTLTDGSRSVMGIISISSPGSMVYVFPNPTSSTVTLQLPESIGPCTILVSDQAGRLLDRRILSDSDQTQLELPDQSGLYFILIEGDTWSEKRQVIKF